MTDLIQQMMHNLKQVQCLIDAGYKELALEFHPDRGGTPEQMAMLNRARERLRDAAASPSFWSSIEAAERRAVKRREAKARRYRI